jgi:hypothetical protein
MAPSRPQAYLRRTVRALPPKAQQHLRRVRNRRRPLPSMSIGVLFGETPWTLEERPEFPNPIVTAADVRDASAAFVADPFAVRRDGEWYLFFEVMNRDSGKGEIAYASSPDLVQWKYGCRVLVEPMHLSYPAIYVTDDTVWMVPESWEANQVRLYRADPFPSRWVLEKVLIDGVAGTDPTLHRRPDGSMSMLLCSAEDGIHNETLLRFDAPCLEGPWSRSPEGELVTGDSSQARPGGHCFDFDGVMYRLGQDCSTRYGESLRTFPLEPPWSVGGAIVIGQDGDGWRSRGGHHADIHPWSGGGLFAFVDGES